MPMSCAPAPALFVMVTTAAFRDGTKPMKLR
jgi:hypothetical protein